MGDIPMILSSAVILFGSTAAASISLTRSLINKNIIVKDCTENEKVVDTDLDLWSKLRRTAAGETTLSSEDAKKILAVIASLTMDTSIHKRKDDVKASIADRLEGLNQNVDEGFVQFLVSNYAKVKDEDIDEQLSNAPNVISSKTVEFSHDIEIPISEDLDEILSKLSEWKFDVFSLESLTPYPLVVVVEHALSALGTYAILDLNHNKLTNFLKEVQASYHPKNPYHNAMHATDVVQTVFHLCTEGQLISAIGLNYVATLSIIIAAAIHDINHPGITGKFIVAASGSLAITYNDRSPLENMHLATAFEILSRPQNTFTESFPVAQYRDMRRLMIEMVIATDMDMHFALTEKLEGLVSVGTDLANVEVASPSIRDLTPNAASPRKDETAFLPSSSSTSGVVPPLASRSSKSSKQRRSSILSGKASEASTKTDSRQLLIMQLSLHAADVSNPAKPFEVYGQWLPRVMEEFYAQGDTERELGMPITFAFDRHAPVPAHKFQLGFIKAIVGPLFRSFSKVSGVTIDHCLESLDSNIRHWESVAATEEASK